MMSSQDLHYRILDVNVAVNCPAEELQTIVEGHWGHLASGEPRAELTYCVSRTEPTSPISIARSGQETKWTSDEGQFLYELEGDVTVELQLIRRDLFFLHAAVAEVGGKAYLFVAESGGGKSTTLWGLLHHGWRYMSDELAPLALSSLRVHAYQRALCLKSPPPQPYPLPPETISTPRTLHVPVQYLPAVSQQDSCPLMAVYFVKYCPDADRPSIRALSAAESSARLYANALNPLAHPNAGLDGAVQIAKSIPGFALESADLAATCDLVSAHRR
jgi:hypothetical protein